MITVKVINTLTAIVILATIVILIYKLAVDPKIMLYCLALGAVVAPVMYAIWALFLSNPSPKAEDIPQEDSV